MARRPLRIPFLLSISLFVATYLAGSIGCGGGAAAGNTPTAPGTPTAPAATAPVVASITPSTIPAGSAAFTLQINGSGFVSGSVASWNGAPLTTTYVSATGLTAAVAASLAASGGTFAIAVANPDGQNSGSSNATLVVDNPIPAIALLSPTAVTAGTGATNVVVTGTGFVQSSVASFAGNARPTTVQSATQLTMALTAADLVTAGQVNITIANPSPGGGVSAPASFTVALASPVITGTTPTSLTVGSPATPVTVMGTGFTAASMILVDGALQTPSSVTATAMNITIPAIDMESANSILLRVENGQLTSNFFDLPVLNPVPAIQSLSTPTVTAGSPSFNLTILATGVLSNTQVNLNGATVASGFLNGFITVPIAANLVAQAGMISISLTNPTPGGGASNIATLNVIAGSNYLRTVNLPANALTWNPQQQVIYAAIPASSSSNASSVVAIDPASGNIVATQQMPGEPTLLAISGDQQYLYVAMSATATIARLKLPALTQDIQWSVGAVPNPNTVGGAIYDMHVAPGLPHTIAVAQEIPSPSATADPLPTTTELAIYDDGVMRPNTANGGSVPLSVVNVIQWGADASTIYGTEDTYSGNPEFIYQINAQGATLASTALGALNGVDSQLVYDSNETRLYDSNGDVVDPATGKLLGSFPASSYSFAVDSSQHRVYFLDVNAENSGYSVTNIAVYDQDSFTSEGTIALPSVTGVEIDRGRDLIRWGAAGLAFNFGSSIYILDGPFVTPGAVPASSVGTYVMPPPQLSGLSPESVVAGSPDTTITLTGQNLTPATTVSWNNSILATTFVNNTEVQATIPAAVLSTPTAAPLYVSNSPGEGISNVLAFSVLPNLGPGMQLSALNLSGADLAWNATNNMLYVAVANNDSIHPQTIATVDPATGTIVSTLLATANPFVLSISGDDQYLYAGFANNANVQRYALPGLTPDLLIPLGIGDPAGSYAEGSTESCDFAVSMGVAPGLDSTIAVTQGNKEIAPPLGCGATAVIDGATPRPENTGVVTSTYQDLSELTWGADATAVYAQGDYGVSDQPISSLTVSSSGIVFNQSSFADIYLGKRPHFDAGTGLIYSDGGDVTQPSTLSQVGNFNASGLMVPDSTLGLAYFLGQTPSQTGSAAQGTEAFTLQIYDLHSYALLDSIVIPNVIGYPNQMIRWGASGIAFTTDDGDEEGNNAPGLTYILSGSEISLPTPAVRQKSVGAEHVRLTWKPRERMRSSSN